MEMALYTNHFYFILLYDWRYTLHIYNNMDVACLNKDQGIIDKVRIVTQVINSSYFQNIECSNKLTHLQVLFEKK